MTYIPKYQINYTLIRIRQLAARKSHSQKEVEREVRAIFEIVSTIPKWKVWRWLPIVVRLASAVNKHSKCCDLDERL